MLFNVEEKVQTKVSGRMFQGEDILFLIRVMKAIENS